MKRAIKKIIIILIIIFNVYGFSSLQSEEKVQSSGIVQIEKKSVLENSAEKNKKDLIDNDKILLRVMLITLITWFALSIYIYVLSRKVKNLEKKLDEK